MAKIKSISLSKIIEYITGKYSKIIKFVYLTKKLHKNYCKIHLYFIQKV